GRECDQLPVELVEHLDDVRLVENRPEVGLAGRRRRVGFLLVDVVLLRLRRRSDESLRAAGPHAELEAHSSVGFPLSAARPFSDGASTCTNRKRCVRPGPWMRSSLNGFSTLGRLTMIASAVVWRPRVGS